MVRSPESPSDLDRGTGRRCSDYRCTRSRYRDLAPDISECCRAERRQSLIGRSHLTNDSRHGRPSTSGATLEKTAVDRKSTRLNSSHVAISYAVFCLKKKT